MKTVIAYLEKRVRTLKNRITKKKIFIDALKGKTWWSINKQRAVEEYILHTEVDIKGYEKAIFFLDLLKGI